MKVLLLNGSPRKEKSCTIRVARKFVDGLKAVTDCEVEEINLSDCNIKQCLGCLSCWGRTEGTCVIKDDDIPMLKEKVMGADVIIESFPLYFFGMPGVVKVYTDRMLSMMNTYEGQAPDVETSFHGIRDAEKLQGKSFFVVSTCGYAQTDLIYDPLLGQLDCICGPGNYYPLLCPQGKCMSIPELHDRMEVFLEKYVDAGREFASTGALTEDTIMNLRVPPFNERRFKLLLGQFWKNERNLNE